MIHIGLFGGIGGFSLAASWMGWKTLVTCEIDPFCNIVLKEKYPDAYHHGDINTLTYETINTELSKQFGTHWRNDDIIVTGGFPCQPYSVAGKRLGKDDSRHLWPEMRRVIREISPQTQGLKTCKNGKTEFLDMKLLPTPQARDYKGECHPTQKCLPNHLKAGLLPTPTNSMVTYQDFAQAKYHSSKRPEYKNVMLQTPQAADAYKTTKTSKQDSLNKTFQTGGTSHLNHRFVMEMMGFPPNYCDFAFEKIAWDYYLKKKSTQSFQKRLLKLEKSQLKQEETR